MTSERAWLPTTFRTCNGCEKVRECRDLASKQLPVLCEIVEMADVVRALAAHPAPEPLKEMMAKERREVEKMIVDGFKAAIFYRKYNREPTWDESGKAYFLGYKVGELAVKLR